MLSGLRFLLKRIKHYYSLGELNKKWQSKNKHNFTSINRLCDIEKISVGNYSYGQLNVHDFIYGANLSIGNFCSIADEVHFFLAGEHHIDSVSTYPYKKNILLEEKESLSKGNIIVEDDVWICSHVMILSGVTIGRGSIIAAGSVVTSDVKPYSIVGGVPARLIKKRFPERVTEIIDEIDYSALKSDFIIQNVDLFYKQVEKLDDNELIDIVSRINKGLNDGKA